MDERERKFNVKGISAFEAAETRTNVTAIPGLEKDKAVLKENFHRTSVGNSINYKKKLESEMPVSPEKLKHIKLGSDAISKAN